MCETHTHVLVRDCSLFPGSSCKTWVRVGKVVPLSELWNPRAQTSLGFAAVVGGKKRQISFLYFYNQCSLLPQAHQIFILLSPFPCVDYIHLFQALMLLLTGKKTPPASKMQIKVLSYNSGFNTKKKHYFSGAFAVDFFFFSLHQVISAVLLHNCR